MKSIGFITGITGQDGSYLTELLLEKGYQVWGLIRRSSSINTQRINHIYNNPNLFLRYGDLSDMTSIVGILNSIKKKNPDLERVEVYNLAALSHVKVSFELPEYCADINGIGTLRVLEAIRNCSLMDITRFYQASTSELYGKVIEIPQSETTPFYPRSPYAVSKLYAYWIVKNYREAYNMYACNGILFNHESPRRGPTFVTRKITIGLGNILKGKQDCIYLGNIDSKRDWGHAKDYVYGMWLMLQQNEPDDFVLATGNQYSIRTFIEKAFKLKGINIKWKGKGINEIGYCDKTQNEYIKINPKYFRPSEVETLLGDPSKATYKLNWSITYDIDKLIEDMVNNDC